MAEAMATSDKKKKESKKKEEKEEESAPNGPVSVHTSSQQLLQETFPVLAIREGAYVAPLTYRQGQINVSRLPLSDLR
jgi:hypothetical protein